MLLSPVGYPYLRYLLFCGIHTLLTVLGRAVLTCADNENNEIRGRAVLKTNREPVPESGPGPGLGHFQVKVV